MSEQAWGKMLESDLSDIPPDDVVKKAVPWKRAFACILAGLILRTLTFQFYGLQLLLPAVGGMLWVIGFSALREENRPFRRCMVLSKILLLHALVALFLACTCWSGLLKGQPAALIVGIVVALLQFALLLCFWQGVENVRKKAGRELPGSAGKLVLWEGAMLLLTLLNISSQFVMWIMLVLFILILLSMVHLVQEMEESGYALKAAPKKISDGLSFVYLLLLAGAVMGCGYGFFSRIPMNWEKQPSLSAEAQAVRSKLRHLGYPEEALWDLSEKDLLLCAKASTIRTCEFSKSIPVNRRGDLFVQLRFTEVMLSQGKSEGEWILLHHFRFLEGAPCKGIDGLSIQSSMLTQEAVFCEDPYGRILEEQDGETRTAFLGRLEKKTSQNLFGNLTALFADFSFTSGACQQRGYVVFRFFLKHPSLETSFDVMPYYFYRASLFELPVRRPEDVLWQMGTPSWPYCTDWAYFLFRSDGETFEMIPVDAGRINPGSPREKGN